MACNSSGVLWAWLIGIVLMGPFVPVDVSAKGPTTNEEQGTEPTDDPSALLEDIDLEDIVVEAMKIPTSVQEAPAIVSVVTDQQMKEMGYQLVKDAVAGIPGFLEYNWVYGAGQVALSRGILSGGMVLRDGLDVMDMSVASPMLDEAVPIELLRRMEVVSGPGGVLWGSNSFVGIINLVSKTADDLQGVEASAGFGTGPGKPGNFRLYVMGGQKFLNDKFKILAHVSYQTWKHAELKFPNQVVLRNPAPQPQMAALYGGATTSDSLRSHLLVFSGNSQLGPFSLHWSLPFGRQVQAASFGASILKESLGEDSIDCTNPANKAACAVRVDPNRIARNVQFNFYDQYAMLRYRTDILDRLKFEGRAFYIYFKREIGHYSSFAPSTILKGSVTADPMDLSMHRGGLTADVNVNLPAKTTLLAGGELYYDYYPEFKVNFLSEEATMKLTTLRCPENASGKIVTDENGYFCPVQFNYQSDRITGGMFLNAQSRLIPNVIMDAGARLQLFGGKRSLDPAFLLSGAVVWSFLPNWNIKANYAEGFRPPPLQKTDSLPTFNWTGSPWLKTERSRAIQGEINTRLLKGYKSIRQLSLRVDYSYTWITDFIEVNQGMYQNLSDIGIHSVEMLADLRLKKGHWFSLGYTFLDMANSQKGKVRSIPNQWLALRSLVNLWRKQLFVSSTLSVQGSAEDPNKRGAVSSAPVHIGNVNAAGEPVQDIMYLARPSDLVMDRVHPVAIWNAGVRFLLPKQGLRFDLDVYNLLNAQAYYGEGFMDLTSYMEMQPNPRSGISVFGRAQYTF
jgi:outer membrane receptor protein involved in Fe transport